MEMELKYENENGILWNGNEKGTFLDKRSKAPWFHFTATKIHKRKCAMDSSIIKAYKTDHTQTWGVV
jgi:hypothetical protein